MRAQCLATVIAIAAAILVTAAPASAANIAIGPTTVELSTRTTSALVKIRNESKAPARLEISVYVWSVQPDGEMKLEPTTDVTFFPKLVELAGGATRNVRIGINAGLTGNVERCYRLLFEELPDNSTPTATAVAIRTKISMPVFVRPSKPQRAAVVERVAVENGQVLTTVRNTGNLHLSVDSVMVHGRDGAGAEKFALEGRGWYVLPGESRVFTVPLTPEQCAGVASVGVNVSGHNGSIQGQASVPAGACAATR